MSQRQELMRKALEIYYEASGREYGDLRNRMTWVLSKDTMEALAGYELKDHEMERGALLCGVPIRRDDTAQGLQYELEPLSPYVLSTTP